MLRGQDQIKTDKHLVSKVCQLARDKNEKGLTRLIQSGVSIGIFQDGYTAVTILAREKNIEAAMFLVKNFYAKMDYLLFGLGLGGHALVATGIIAASPVYARQDLNRNFICGLGQGGYIQRAKEEIAAAPERERSSLREVFIQGICRIKLIQVARQEIASAQEGERADLRRNLVLGLGGGIFGLGCHIEEATEEIAVAPANERDQLRREFMLGLGRTCNIREAKALIASAPELERPLLNQKLLIGLGRECYIQEAKAEIASANQDMRTILRVNFVDGLERGGYIDGREESTLRLMVAADDKELREAIFLGAIKRNPQESILVKEAENITRLKSKYLLDNFDQAKSLVLHWKSVFELFLYSPQFCWLKDIPAEIFMYIASFVLNLSDHDTDKVFKAVHERLSFGLMEGLFNKRMSGSISHGEYLGGLAKETERYGKRISFNYTWGKQI